MNFADPMGLCPTLWNGYKEDPGGDCPGRSPVAGMAKSVANASNCVGAAGLFSTALTMDFATLITGAGVARTGVRLAGATIESLVSTSLRVGEKAAGAGALAAADAAVKSGGSFAKGTVAGVPGNFALGFVESGRLSLESLVPFKGTGARSDRVATACQQFSEAVVGK